MAMLTGLLDLEGFEVVGASEDRGGKVRRLVVVPTDVAGLCPHCGRATDDRHACHDREVTDLSLGGWKTHLVARLWQFRCGGCGKFFTPRQPGPGRGGARHRAVPGPPGGPGDPRGRVHRRPVLRRPGEDGRAVVLRAPGAAAEGPGEGPGAGAVAGDRRAEHKKRHRRFACVLIDHTNGRVLDVLETREKAAVVAWLTREKAAGLLASLAEVTCDMWDAYAEAAREVFGEGEESVRVTVDRFHVMKNFQDRLGDARREVQRKLPKEQARELKGSRWLWVTNPQNLEREQRAELERLKRKFPELAKLSRHREALRRTSRSAAPRPGKASELAHDR